MFDVIILQLDHSEFLAGALGNSDGCARRHPKAIWVAQAHWAANAVDSLLESVNQYQTTAEHLIR